MIQEKENDDKKKLDCSPNGRLKLLTFYKQLHVSHSETFELSSG